MKIYIAKRRLIVDAKGAAIEAGKKVEGLSESELARLLAMRAVEELDLGEDTVESQMPVSPENPSTAAGIEEAPITQAENPSTPAGIEEAPVTQAENPDIKSDKKRK